MLGAKVVEGIPRHATVSDYGACINKFVDTYAGMFELGDDFDDDELPEGSSALMLPCNGHGGAGDDQDEPAT